MEPVIDTEANPPNVRHDSTSSRGEDVIERRPRARVVNRNYALRLGVDFGKLHDPSAYVLVEPQARCVVEHRWDPVTADWIAPIYEMHFMVRRVQRLPIDTSYPQIAAEIARLVAELNGPRFREYRTPRIYCDATGLGTPVVDLLKQHLLGRDYVLRPVVFTAGQRVTRTGAGWGVPKAALVSRLQVLLEQGLIHLGESPEAKALGDELRDFRQWITDSAQITAGAKAGSHDDLVVALALACFDRERGPEIRRS